MRRDFRNLSIEFVKKNKHEIIENFANDEVCSPEENPISIFMAGSIGAGKTEFFKNLLRIPRMRAVRIDSDEIKEFIPYYNGRNAAQIQGASSLGVEYLHDYILRKKKSMIMDGTFSDFEKSSQNIERSIKRKRPIEIFYLYQEPLIAWVFAKARERLKGRFISREMFIDSFFGALNSVNGIKKKFGAEVKLHLVIKSYENSLKDFRQNIVEVADYLTLNYTRSHLAKLL